MNPNGTTLSYPPLHTAITTAASLRASMNLSERIITVMTFLLNAGADPNLVGRGTRPLHLAVAIKNEELALRVIQLLIKERGRPHSRKCEGTKS